MIYLIFRWVVAGFCYCGDEIYIYVYVYVYIKTGFPPAAVELDAFASTQTSARFIEKRGGSRGARARL